MPTLMTKAEFARSRGVTRAALTAWQAKGFLILSTDGSGRVDIAATNRLLDARPFQHKGRPSLARTVEAAAKPAGRHPAAPAFRVPAPLPDSPESSSDDWSTAEAVRRKECAVAKIKQLEFEQRAGKLLPADEVESVWREYLTDCRKRLLTVASQCGARLSLSRAEIDVIDREIRSVLLELAGESQ